MLNYFKICDDKRAFDVLVPAVAGSLSMGLLVLQL
jgi:hypothetical protein